MLSLFLSRLTYLGITFSCLMQTTRHCHFAVTNLSARTYVNDALCFYAKLPFYIFLSFSIPPFILSSLSHSGSLYFCSLQYLYVPICLLTFLSVCASVAIVLLLLLLLLFRLKIFLATFSDETDLRWRSSRYLFSYLLTYLPTYNIILLPQLISSFHDRKNNFQRKKFLRNSER